MVDDKGKVGFAAVSMKDTKKGSQTPKLVYVKYKDHVYFKNYPKPPSQAIERETVGWVKQESTELLLIVCDKAASVSEGQVNGLVILKSCILEMVELALKIGFEQGLNSQGALLKTRVRASSQRSEKLSSKIPKRSEK